MGLWVYLVKTFYQSIEKKENNVILITNKEYNELEEIRKEIHKYIEGDVQKFWRFEPLTGKLFRIVHRKRNFKWFLKTLLKGE